MKGKEGEARPAAEQKKSAYLLFGRARVAGALVFRARNAPARKEINDLPGS